MKKYVIGNFVRGLNVEGGAVYTTVGKTGNLPCRRSWNYRRSPRNTGATFAHVRTTNCKLFRFILRLHSIRSFLFSFDRSESTSDATNASLSRDRSSSKSTRRHVCIHACVNRNRIVWRRKRLRKVAASETQMTGIQPRNCLVKGFGSNGWQRAAN